jgi:hypothetical protein
MREFEMTRLSPDQIRRNGDGDTRLLSPAELDEAMKDAARAQEWLADERPMRVAATHAIHPNKKSPLKDSSATSAGFLIMHNMKEPTGGNAFGEPVFGDIEWRVGPKPPYRLLWPVAGGVALFAVLVMIGRALL